VRSEMVGEIGEVLLWKCCNWSIFRVWSLAYVLLMPEEM